MKGFVVAAIVAVLASVSAAFAQTSKAEEALRARIAQSVIVKHATRDCLLTKPLSLRTGRRGGTGRSRRCAPA